MKPFDVIKAMVKNERLNVKKIDYKRFYTQRILSTHRSTFGLASMVNSLYHMDDQLHYDLIMCLLNKNYYGVWPKSKEAKGDVKMLADFYDTGIEEAEYLNKFLTEEQINKIKAYIENKEGGIIK